MILIDRMDYHAGSPKYLYGLVIVKDTWLDATFEKMELTLFYAGRYKQTVCYDEMYYYDQALRENGLYIRMAEELPLMALLEPRFDRVVFRFLGSYGKKDVAFLEELAVRGNKLYVNHGSGDDYIVVARKVTIKDAG